MRNLWDSAWGWFMRTALMSYIQRAWLLVRSVTDDDVVLIIRPDLGMRIMCSEKNSPENILPKDPPPNLKVAVAVAWAYHAGQHSLTMDPSRELRMSILKLIAAMGKSGEAMTTAPNDSGAIN